MKREKFPGTGVLLPKPIMRCVVKGRRTGQPLEKPRKTQNMANQKSGKGEETSVARKWPATCLTGRFLYLRTGRQGGPHLKAAPDRPRAA